MNVQIENHILLCLVVISVLKYILFISAWLYRLSWSFIFFNIAICFPCTIVMCAGFFSSLFCICKHFSLFTLSGWFKGIERLGWQTTEMNWSSSSLSEKTCLSLLSLLQERGETGQRAKFQRHTIIRNKQSETMSWTKLAKKGTLWNELGTQKLLIPHGTAADYQFTDSIKIADFERENS